jgi:transposase
MVYCMFLLLAVAGLMDMPLEYGSYKTVWRRLKRWQDEGVWDSIFKELASIVEHKEVSVDSLTVDAKKKKKERGRNNGL